MRFDNPLILALFPAAAALTIFFSVKSRGSRHEKLFYTTIRIILLFLLMLSLAGLSIIRPSEGTATIFAFDLSASAGNNRDKYISLLRDFAKIQGANDMTGVVCFGSDSFAEALPAKELRLNELISYVDTDGTDISRALSLSYAMLPQDMKKRIILVSDGNENLGGSLAQAQALSAGGAVIDCYAVPTYSGSEVQLEFIKAAEHTRKGAKTDIEISAYSTNNCSARITVYKNDRLIISKDTELSAGNNSFVFSDISDEGGGIIYRAELYADSDGFSENNSVSCYSYVEDIPRILLAGNDGSADELARLLSGSQVECELVSARMLPASAARLAVYDTVILCDLAADDLPAGFMEAAGSYAEDYGGGLLTTGGENSYALGDWFGTRLAEILPVDMELKDEKLSANLGIVMVIDRSGSMTGGSFGISKLELAKEALVRCVDNFSPNDVLGVLTFDDTPDWTVEPQKIEGSADKIKNRVSSITSGGGTSILTALNEAYAGLRETDATIKHIILLTDGQAETTGYEGLLAGLSKDGITLSAIAVGSDADIRLLQTLAGRGGGRYYFTDEFTDLPKLFLKETQLAGKQYLNNYSFFPKAYKSEVLDGISALPELDGYVSTTIKPDAEPVLASDKDEPVLALRKAGLGRTASFTSDTAGMWSAGFLSSEEGAEVLRNTVSWLMRTPLNPDYSLEAVKSGGSGKLMLHAPYGEDIESVSASVTSSSGEKYDLKFSAESPGLYSADIPGISSGSYISAVSISRGDGTTVVPLGFSIPYSVEYDVTMTQSQNGLKLLRDIAEAAGGRLISENESLGAETLAEAYSYGELRMPLLIASLCLFFADIFVRRFGLTPRIKKRHVQKAPRIPALAPLHPIVPEQEAKPEVNTSAMLLNLKRKRRS